MADKIEISSTNAAVHLLSRQILSSQAWYASDSENQAKANAFRALTLLESFPEPKDIPIPPPQIQGQKPEAHPLYASFVEAHNKWADGNCEVSISIKLRDVWKKCLGYFLSKGQVILNKHVLSLMTALEMNPDPE